MARPACVSGLRTFTSSPPSSTFDSGPSVTAIETLSNVKVGEPLAADPVPIHPAGHGTAIDNLGEDAQNDVEIRPRPGGLAEAGPGQSCGPLGAVAPPRHLALGGKGRQVTLGGIHDVRLIDDVPATVDARCPMGFMARSNQRRRPHDCDPPLRLEWQRQPARQLCASSRRCCRWLVMRRPAGGGPALKIEAALIRLTGPSVYTDNRQMGFLLASTCARRRRNARAALRATVWQTPEAKPRPSIQARTVQIALCPIHRAFAVGSRSRPSHV